MNNTYLDEVMQQQQRVEQELQRGGTPVPSMPIAAASVPAAPGLAAPSDHDEDGEEAKAPPRNFLARVGKSFISQKKSLVDFSDSSPHSFPRVADFRITGYFRQTVVVSPNVYVIHTRAGHPEPLHIGLGISFQYNRYTDAFLIVPASLQTIVINARCISTERQGILVQAYVQWIVDNIHTAYRKLDFSDPNDPMRIVNVQLREQAEAAIKDKVATMSIDAILSDKQPIIEELTYRLRAVV